MAHVLKEECLESDGVTRRAFDLQEVVTSCDDYGASIVALDCVVAEATTVITTRVQEYAWSHGIRPRKHEKLRAKAQSELQRIAGSMLRLPGEMRKHQIQEARDWFVGVQKDLGETPAGMPKDPIPERGDLEILVRAVSLEAQGQKILLSKDKHFTGYVREIQERWGLVVAHIGYWGRSKEDLGL